MEKPPREVMQWGQIPVFRVKVAYLSYQPNIPNDDVFCMCVQLKVKCRIFTHSHHAFRWVRPENRTSTYQPKSNTTGILQQWLIMSKHEKNTLFILLYKKSTLCGNSFAIDIKRSGNFVSGHYFVLFSFTETKCTRPSRVVYSIWWVPKSCANNNAEI